MPAVYNKMVSALPYQYQKEFAASLPKLRIVQRPE
jgi:hypothetical protein